MRGCDQSGYSDITRLSLLRDLEANVLRADPDSHAPPPLSSVPPPLDGSPTRRGRRRRVPKKKLSIDSQLGNSQHGKTKNQPKMIQSPPHLAPPLAVAVAVPARSPRVLDPAFYTTRGQRLLTNWSREK